MGYSNAPEAVNRRHLNGLRRFQAASLKALSCVIAALPSPVKAGDMKSLVSAYKEAVEGERMVLGLGVGASVWPDGISVRWVDDEDTEAGEPN